MTRIRRVEEIHISIVVHGVIKIWQCQVPKRPPSLVVHACSNTLLDKRFWGLYVHVCKHETLYEAYRLAKKNNGAPGVDGVTFEAFETEGVEKLIDQLHRELSEGMRPGKVA